MAKTRKSKSLDMSTIQTVDENGDMVAQTMNEIAAENRVSKAVSVELSRATISLPFFGKEILVRRYNDGSIYFGAEHLGNKRHINDHWKIMGFFNSIAGVRLGHYAVIEEGIHLRHTFNQLHKLYEGKFGYVNFANPELDPKWIAQLKERGIEGSDHNYWISVMVNDEHDLYRGFKVHKHEKLEEVAQRLGKTIATLSPFTISNWKEGRNTKNKREGLESLQRVANGELCVATKPVIKTGQEWMLRTQEKRFNALLLTDLQKLADIINGSANGAEEQKRADQDAFVTNGDETVREATVASVAQGELVVFGGQKYPASKLVRARIIKVSGQMEVGSPIFLRDLTMVARQFELAADKGMTIKVLSLPA